MTAVATAATPSPRPVRPSPSVVVAETLTGAPTAAESAASDSARRGPRRGRLPITCTATFPISKPAARTRAAVSVSSVAPEAPAHCGSDVPKFEPRSPKAAADRSASQAAWAATSASEWPSSPCCSSGQDSPPRCMGTPSTRRWTSVPMPTRGSCCTGRSCPSATAYVRIGPVKSSRVGWSVAGLIAGYAGVAASYCMAMMLTTRDAPVTAIAERITRMAPGPVVERAIRILGHWDKPFLLLVILLGVGAAFAWAGLLARRSWWAPVIVYGVLALVGAAAVRWQPRGATVDLLPVAVGFATWLVCLSLLTEPLRRLAAAPESAAPTDTEHTRRTFLLRTDLILGASVAAGGVGRVVGRGRRHVEEARRLLRLPGVSEPTPPPGVRLDLEGITPWATRARDF